MKYCKRVLLLLLAILAAISFWGCEFISQTARESHPASQAPVSQAAGITFGNGKLEVAFLDVGQGDSILLKTPGDKVMLIDAGESTARQAVKEALDSSGIERIDVLIATHPDSDHIGSMRMVVENYEIGEIYMPKVNHTTKTYQNLLQAISDKGMKIKAARAGKSIAIDDALQVEILGPVSEEYSNTNNYSVICRVTYGDTRFLFLGDAEHEAQDEAMAAAPESFRADVLKLAHHGSSNGISAELLEAVQPRYGVISCGADNSYGHPHRETLDLLAKYRIETFRTDKLGTIVAASDGETITFNKTGEILEDIYGGQTVYKTRTGKTYHREGCSSLSGGGTPLTIEQAREAGLTPCKKCFTS